MTVLLVEQLVRTEKPTTIAAYFWVYSSVLLAMTAVFGWEPLMFDQVCLLALCGIMGGLAQLFMAEGLRWAPAAL